MKSKIRSHSVLFATRHSPFTALVLSVLLLAILYSPFARSATVTGNLTDISLQALNTKITFSPTNDVLLTDTGLSAGPPRTIDVANGQFSIVLDSGDYTVSLPLITYRRPFKISVFATNGTVNITNLLSPPRTYTYTTPYVPPFHVNTSRVIAWSTNSESTLLDSTATIPAGTLASRNFIVVEATGSFSDPAGNSPNARFRLKLGSTTIVTQIQTVVDAHWHLRAILTVRSPGASGTAVATLACTADNGGIGPFPLDTQTATIDTTSAQSISLTAQIDNITDAESVTCDQLAIHLE
jgi:hypothetical protein